MLYLKISLNIINKIYIRTTLSWFRGPLFLKNNTTTFWQKKRQSSFFPKVSYDKGASAKFKKKQGELGGITANLEK